MAFELAHTSYKRINIANLQSEPVEKFVRINMYLLYKIEGFLQPSQPILVRLGLLC